MRVPVALFASGAVVVLILVGAILATAQRHAQKNSAPAVNVTHHFSVPPPSPVAPPHMRLHRERERRSSSGRDEAVVLAASSPAVEQLAEATDTCGRCRGRCQLFDSSSPICCTAQCNRNCPILMASVGCEKTAKDERNVNASTPECERCQQVCQYAGSACCMSA